MNAERPMTPDELEANGFPRNFHDLGRAELRATVGGAAAEGAPCQDYDPSAPPVVAELTTASASIQWKGTDACLDIHCGCGAHTHFDGDFAYAIECGACGIKYDVSDRIALRPFSGRHRAVVSETSRSTEAGSN